jgi:hypothetical protein
MAMLAHDVDDLRNVREESVREKYLAVASSLSRDAAHRRHHSLPSNIGLDRHRWS